MCLTLSPGDITGRQLFYGEHVFDMVVMSGVNVFNPLSR